MIGMRPAWHLKSLMRRVHCCQWYCLLLSIYFAHSFWLTTHLWAQTLPVVPPSDSTFSANGIDKRLFQRVFVPEDQVGKLVPRDYMPIAVSDLESLLDKYETGEGLEWESQPKITRTIYTARLQGDQLLSDFNYWEIQYQDDVAGFLPIKPWNLAITNPLNNPGRESLSWAESAQWYVDANGLLWLPIQDSTPLWFGWKATTSESPNHTRSFSFHVPPATRNQLLLLLESGIEVRCADAVVREILPSSVPTELDGVSQPLVYEALKAWIDRNNTGSPVLWLLDFNGGNKLNLTFQAKRSQPHENRQALVASMLQQYRMNENGIDLLTRIGMLNAIDDSELYIETDDQLKVREIKLGDQVLQWSTVSSAPSQIRVDLQGITDSNRLSQFQITSFISRDQGSSSTLPCIKVSNSLVLKGDTVLECRPPVVPIRVAATGGEAIVTNEAGNAVDGNLGRWQWRWSGTPPRIDVATSAVQKSVDANSLTRLNVIKGSLNATSWVRLSPQIKSGGEARFQLGEGWILDSATAEPGSVLKVSDTVLPDGTEIVLRWEKYITDEQLTFELQAHRAIETDTLEISLPDLKFLDLKDGQQSGVVAVETTGRYLVKPTPTMLALLSEEEQLSSWQTAKLPRFSNSWLLKAQDGQLPALVFTSEPSTFTGKWDVFVSPEPNGISEEYRMQFRPLFGAMDRVLVRLRNSSEEELLWQWDDGGKPYLLRATREVSDTGSESYMIVLPRPVNEPFSITAKRNVPTKQWVPVPLPTSDQATSEELVVHISKLLNSRLPETGWISVIDSDADALGEYAMYRAESSLADSVSVARQDPAVSKKVWAIRGEHEIRCFSDGAILHECVWSIANCRGETLQIAIPPESRWIDVRLDGAIIPYTLDTKSSQTATISLPTTTDGGRLQVVFVEQSGPLSFRSVLPIRRATIDCGVVEFTETLLTPSLYSVVRAEDYSTLYGSNPVHKLSGLLDAMLLGNSEGKSVFAKTQPLPAPTDNGLHDSNVDNIVQWNRFALMASRDSQDGTMYTVLWDTRFLCCTILMFGLAVGVLAVWGWIRLPKFMCGLMLILMAISTTFTDLYSLTATYTLALIAIAWLLALTQIGARVFSTKAHYSVSVRSHNTITRKAIPLIGFLVLSISISQQQGNAQEAESGTYGILIPFTPEGEIKGNYVYVPIEAYQFLTNPGGKSYAPRSPYMIRQVSYQFRATEGVSMMDRSNFQLIADYEIEVLDPAVPVRWPIGSGRAALERLVVNQFEIIPGFTVRQDDLAILWYPERSGLFKLRLQLRPISTSTELDQFDIPIPQVPTGTLTLLAPASKKVKVNGIFVDGANGVPGNYQLGEQNRLAISVLGRDDLIEDSSPLDSEVDAWLHFQGDTAFLMTQIRMRYGDSAIPKKITLQMGDQWTPVGLNWGDGKWDGLTTNLANGLVTYNINVQSTSMTEAVIYTAWKPKESWLSVGINPPLFPESSLVNPLQFSLATSSSPDSIWLLDTPEGWTEETGDRALSRWENRGLGIPAKSYVSSSRASIPSIQLRESTVPMDIDEVCDTIARGSHFDMNYEATWSNLSNGTELLLFAIPDGVRINSLVVNGTPRLDFRLVRSEARTLLSLTNINSVGLESNKLTCQASLPLKLGEPVTVPRITGVFGNVNQSFLRLHRETNLVMRLEDVDQLPDSRQMLDRSSEDMLKSNQVGVLQVELADHFNGSSQLPARLTVIRQSGSIDGSTLGLLISNNDRWRYTLITRLRSKDSPLDTLVFELPASVTSQMEITPPCPFRLDPSPDGSHQLLSLFPTSPITEEQVHTISFELNRVSGQVSLPQVSLVGSGALVHRVGLPQFSGQHNFTWRTTGLRPEPIPTEFEAMLNTLDGVKDISFQFLEPTSRRYQADLQSDKSNSPKMSVKLVHYGIELDKDSHALIKSTYWIDPEGFLTARFSIPEGMILIGAIENGSPQAIQREPLTGIQSVTIQPSNLPTKLELILKSQEVKSWQDFKVPLPTGINLEVEKSMVEFVMRSEQDRQLEHSLFKLDSELTSPLTRLDALDIESSSILKLLTDAEATIASYNTGSLGQWSEAWRKELSENRPALAANEVVNRWLERLGNGPPDTVSNEGLKEPTMEDMSTGIVMVKSGTIATVEVQSEKQPFQVHLSNLFAISLLVVGLVWLMISGSKIAKLFERLAQTPSISLGVFGVILAIFSGYPWLGISVLGLAVLSLVLQVYKHLTYRKGSPSAPTASKRKITA
jgi:hypothetical protein